MVNTGKRQRHKEGHRSRVEAARAAESKRRRTRSFVVVGVALAAMVAVFVAVTVTRDDDQQVTAGSSTSSTPTSGPSSSTPGVQLPAPPDGRTIKGSTPCPEGDEERAVAFEEAPPVCIDPKATYRATVTTSKGPIVIDLDAVQSPVAVNNFVVLARYHYFDGLPFNRIVTDFVDQTGSSGRPDYGSGGPGYSLPDEGPKKPYEKGTVAMAVRGGSGEVSGSQFFFTIDPTSLQGGAYPILGTVTDETQAVVDEINTFGSPSSAGEPTEVITIEKVEITGP